MVSRIYANLPDPTPNTPVALLRHALRCMDDASLDPQLVFHAAQFHRMQEDGTCRICAAGAVIHKLTPLEQRGLPDYFAERLRAKLWFISDVACDAPNYIPTTLREEFNIDWDSTKHSLPNLETPSPFNHNPATQERIMRDNITKMINVLEGYGFQ